MNNEVLPTTYLGRELPKEYVNSIEKGETFPEWLTMFPHTEYEHNSAEIGRASCRERV